MKCKNCNQQIDNNTRYCQFCESANNIENETQKNNKYLVRHIISSIINYILIILIYYSMYKISENKSNEYMAGFAELINIFIMITPVLSMLLLSISTGIIMNKEKKRTAVIVNMIIISVMNLPLITVIIISLIKIFF